MVLLNTGMQSCSRKNIYIYIRQCLTTRPVTAGVVKLRKYELQAHRESPRNYTVITARVLLRRRASHVTVAATGNARLRPIGTNVNKVNSRPLAEAATGD